MCAVTEAEGVAGRRKLPEVAIPPGPAFLFLLPRKEARLLQINETSRSHTHQTNRYDWNAEKSNVVCFQHFGWLC